MSKAAATEVWNIDDDPPASAAPEWMGRLTHDLRGSIGTIQMAARMLEGSGLSAQQVPELGRTVERQANLLLQLADELDDLQSIGLGMFCLQRAPCGLGTIVENAAAHASQYACSIGRESHPIAVLAPAAPILVDADPARLQQLVAQMLGAVPAVASTDPRCWIECTASATHAIVRLHDDERRIYHSDAVDYLVTGNPPIDPGTLAMEAVIGRQIAVAHGAVVSTGDEVDGRIGELLLQLPLAGAQE